MGDFRGFVLTAILSVFLFACEDAQQQGTKDFVTDFETSGGMQTTTYEKLVSYYLDLAKTYSQINVQTIGTTDSGHPLHLVTYNPDGDFNFNKIREEKTVMFINNGIHPGESDGIDATMMLFRDLANGKLAAPENVVITAIAVYNVGGMLNRNSGTRANQNGPMEHGFRGNSRNFDLNRDFIKMDTKNAETFAEAFHTVQPDIFIDTHVSNGADYQYVLTHLFTQHNKLGGELGNYVESGFQPMLEKKLQEKNWPITPYVNVFNKPPDNGFSQFLDNPRYSSGYTTLWNTIGFMVETHMLKPYKDRVEGTLEILVQTMLLADTEFETIKDLREKASKKIDWSDHYPLNWAIDTTKVTHREFLGFSADTVTSETTGLPRLKYDRESPFTKTIEYQNHYKPTDSIQVPLAYVLKKGWTKPIDRLLTNHVEVFEIPADTVLEVESYRIEDYKTYPAPFEGHYPHYNTRVSSKKQSVALSKGDIFIPTRQRGIRYIIETLEPSAPDSFFNWNFFDTVLQRKEGFSPYVFEDTALNMLENDSILRKEFEAKKVEDEEFKNSSYNQLNWLYQRSSNYEPAHMAYPVYRLMATEGNLDYLENHIFAKQ